MKDASGCPRELAHAHSGEPAAKTRRDGFDKEGPLAEAGSRKRGMPKLVKMDRDGCLRQAHAICDGYWRSKNIETEAAANEMVGELGFMFRAPVGHISDIIELVSFAEETDDEILSRLFEFEGYEGRARDAICDALIAIACDPNPEARRIAYVGLEYVGGQRALELLLLQALEEKEAITPLVRAIRKIAKTDRDKERVVEGLKALLGADDGRVRLAVASLFLGFTGASTELVFAMLAEEHDGGIAETLLYKIYCEPEQPAEAMARAINRHLSGHPDIAKTFFGRNIAKMDAEEFAGLLSPETRRLLAELGKPEGMFTFQYLVAYEYFRAACENRLVEACVMGKKFKYVLLPAELMCGSEGMVNIRAIAVSEDVPEKLRPVVAYHEFVEGQTGSHKKAVKAEIKAVLNLGLDAEYRKWVAGLEPDAAKGREAYRQAESVF